MLKEQAVPVRFDLEILWLKLFCAQSASIVALSLILFLVLHSQADRGWEHWKPHLASREESILWSLCCNLWPFQKHHWQSKTCLVSKEKLCHYVTNQSVKYTLPHIYFPFFQIVKIFHEFFILFVCFFTSQYDLDSLILVQFSMIYAIILNQQSLQFIYRGICVC